MRVGFLHLGIPTSGPARFGRLLARFVAAHTDLQVVEVEVAPGSMDPRWAEIRASLRQLSGVDVVHVQYSPGAWGGRFGQLRTALALTMTRLAVVVTAHDVIADMPPSTRWTLKILGKSAARVLVSTEIERSRLRRLGVASNVTVLPHFVEARPGLPARGAARASLGLDGRRVVTVLGFVHRQKGQDRALETVRYLPEDTVLILAGGPVPGDRGFLARIRADIEAMQIEDRVRITGYLDEAEMDRYLAASDVGFLPFRDAAASGSACTWLAAGVPLVGSDIPLLREYREQAPAVFELVPDGHPRDFADALLGASRTREVTEQAGKLADRFSPRRTAARLLTVYRQSSGR